MVYHRERIQVKISSGKKHTGQSSEKVPNTRLPLSSPHEVMDKYMTKHTA